MQGDGDGVCSRVPINSMKMVPGSKMPKKCGRPEFPVRHIMVCTSRSILVAVVVANLAATTIPNDFFKLTLPKKPFPICRYCV